jgi:hypothetical protein
LADRGQPVAKRRADQQRSRLRCTRPFRSGNGFRVTQENDPPLFETRRDPKRIAINRVSAFVQPPRKLNSAQF